MVEFNKNTHKRLPKRNIKVQHRRLITKYSKAFSYNNGAIPSQNKGKDLGCFNSVTKGLKVSSLNFHENKYLSTYRRHGLSMSFDVLTSWIGILYLASYFILNSCYFPLSVGLVTYLTAGACTWCYVRKYLTFFLTT